MAENPGMVHLTANTRLFDFGILASVAGHNGIAQQVVKRLRKASADATEPKTTKRIGQYVALLSSLVAADRGDHKLAYKILLKADIKGDAFLVKRRLALPHLFRPLFEFRKKLSFVTGIEESKLAKPGPLLPRPSAFPRLNCKFVKTIGSARDKSSGRITGKVAPRKSGGKKKKKSRVLD